MHLKTTKVDPGAPVVAEVVSFRLMPGTDPAAFAHAAQGTEALLRATPGFIRRRLVQADDGQWTDWVEWQNLMTARQAAEAVMAAPEFAPFMAMIDPATVAMRHDAVIVAMD